MQKENYMTPEMEIIRFESEDVITASNTSGEGQLSLSSTKSDSLGGWNN